MRFKTIPILAISASLLFGASFTSLNAQESQQIEVLATSESYWGDILNTDKTGQELFSQLNSKIKSKSSPGYDSLWTNYKKTDLVPGTTDKIWDMYGGFFFNYQSGGKSYSKEGDCYNREHSIPQDWFSSASKGDIAFVVPTDGKVNGVRSNYIFGEVLNASYNYSFPARNDGNGNPAQLAGSSKLGSPKAINGVTTSQSKVFEPDDQYKGDFARICLYFATCYPGDGISGSYGSAFYKSSFPYLTDYGVALCLKWNAQDPVSQKERDRNDGIQEVQSNRNPFVDNNEWVTKIWGSSPTPTPTPTPTPGEKTVTSIEVTDARLGYKVGDSFQKPVVTATYNNNTTKDVTDDCVFEGFDSSEPKDLTITVKYTENNVTVQTTYQVRIKAPDTPTPAKGGCGGDIATTSIILASVSISLFALITISKLVKKKKHE